MCGPEELAIWAWGCALVLSTGRGDFCGDGERWAWADWHNQVVRTFYFGIRNLSKAASQQVRSYPLGDKELIFPLSPKSTPPMGQLISGV